MRYSQYLRVESLAGGVGCSPREFVEAAHSLLAPDAKKHAKRTARHQWLREGLRQRDDARALVRHFRL